MLRVECGQHIQFDLEHSVTYDLLIILGKISITNVTHHCEMLVMKWRPRLKTDRWTFDYLPSKLKRVLKMTGWSFKKLLKKIALKLKCSAKKIKTRENNNNNNENIQTTQVRKHVHTQYKKANQKNFGTNYVTHISAQKNVKQHEIHCRLEEAYMNERFKVTVYQFLTVCEQREQCHWWKY